MTLIKNMRGTELSVCNCGTWFSHWKKFSKQYTDFCVVEGCHNTDIRGAHVQQADVETEDCYVVPLCTHHQQSADVLKIVEKCILVSANKADTCCKS